MWNKKIISQFSSVHKFWVVQILVGVSFFSLMTYLFISSIIRDQTLEFSRQSANSLNRLQERLVINETALSGFANLLQVSGLNNLDKLRSYTQEMRRTYDQLYMFEALVGIDPKDQKSFAFIQQEKGQEDYKVYRYVSIRSTTGKPSKPYNLLKDTPVMFPVFFMDPVIEATKGLLGFDMMSAKVPREPLIQALLSGQKKSSRPYNLVEGGTGYILYQPLKAVTNPTGEDAIGTVVVAVMVLGEPMLSHAQAAIPEASVSLMHGAKRQLVAKSLEPSSATVPVWGLDTLMKEYRLDKYDQPFNFVIRQTVGLYSEDIKVFVLFELLLLLSVAYFMHTSFVRRRNGIQRDEAVIQLAIEHDLLEEKVEKRTAALQKTSDANRDLARKIIEVQEGRYHYLARELHDEAGQTLTAITTNAHLLEQMETDPHKASFVKEISAHSDTLYRKVYHMIEELRPEVLDAFGLKAAIEDSISKLKFRAVNTKVVLDLDPAIDKMDDTFVIATYRIVQELFNNARKYAQANQIALTLQIEQDTLFIHIKDDGQGFDTADSPSGYGIMGVKERVQILTGQFSIHSVSRQGVEIRIHIPLKNQL